MKRILLISLFVLLGALSAFPQAIQKRLLLTPRHGKIGAQSVIPVPDSDTQNSKVPILRWKNGESLPGDIQSANETAITWKSPAFDDPLQIDWHVLDRIAWSPENDSVQDPFSFALKDGSFIYGDIVSINDDSITITSTRHGETQLKKSEVLCVRRQNRGSLIFSGPNGNLGWVLMQNQPDGNLSKSSNPSTDYTPALATGPSGQFQIRNWNRGAWLPNVTLPDQLDLAFRVSSSERPDFVIYFGDTTSSALRLETWDDELVLASGDDFTAVEKLDETDRTVALRILWDKKAQTCSVFKESGELLTTWKVPAPALPFDSHLILQNKGIDLALDSLQVRSWDGTSLPSKIDPKLPNLELSDGRRIPGQFISGGAGTIKIQKAGETAPSEFPVTDLDELVFSTDSPTPAATPEMKLLYNDGTLLLGHLVSITDGKASIATSFTTTPLVSDMDSARRLLIRLPVPAPTTGTPPTVQPDITTLDKIQVGETVLHGTLVCSGDALPRWNPVGGVAPARPASGISTEITKAPGVNLPPATDPALFYLSSGDVIPGNLKSIDKDGAEIESSLVSQQKFTTAELNAIQFVNFNSVTVKGFNDPAWKVIRGDAKTVRITDNTLSMDSGTAIACPNLMQCGEIRFNYTSGSFSGVRFRLFCAGKDESHSINLLLGNTGNQLYSGLETTEGQFDGQVQTAVKQSSDVPIRLSIGEHLLELFVNGISVQQFPIETDKCAGSGLIIEPAGLWGNPTYTVNLSGFSCTPSAGRTWIPEVSPEVKSQILTVPRFEKNDPPVHLLLAGNGDVLRGEIEAATDSHFGFRCGLETLNVPRDRVKAVIILKPVDKADKAAAAPQPSAASPLDVANRQGTPMRMNFGQMTLSNLVNYLHGAYFDCNFTLPNKDMTRPVSFTGQTTLREVLDRMSLIFDLRYRLDTDGTIILESSDQLSTDFPHKSFWLKMDKLPKPEGLKDELTAKGITFPKGSTVLLEPRTGLLSMSNTDDNLTKLSGLIDSDYGGSLGTPTHWLLLSNGARFAIAADKFGPDYIEGHHPIFGTFKVPTGQVISIRSTEPSSTATMESMENWSLVNAPEPVLPEGDSANSPLMGKAASTFKAPLLEGGTFDLATLKGKIVVVDFWATWCGPCVKSLPGLVQALSTFPSDRVQLVALNQGESASQVKRFLKMRGLNFPVGLDSDQSIAQKYGVQGIPRTLVIGPDGVIAWDQTGYDEDGEGEMSGVIKKLLAAPASGSAPANPAK